MKINVNSILKSDGNEQIIDSALPSKDYCLSLPDYELIGDIKLNAILTNISGVLQLKYTMSYAFNTECSRCLQSCSSLNEVNYVENFYKEESQFEDKVYSYSSGILDLSNFIIDTLNMNQSMKYLCSDSCKGICFHCGNNLNHQVCNCKLESIDSTLGALKNYLSE